MGTLSKPLRALFVCALLAVQLAVLPQASGQGLEDRRSEADALRARIESQGERLSMANEDFNAARLETERIEREASAAREQAAEAEARWNELKTKLGERVRMLYKHPAAALDAWLGARSFSEFQRAEKYGSEVLASDTKLLLETEKARHEVQARAEGLAALRDEARRTEDHVAARQAEVSRELSRQRQLLAGVTDEIAAIMEQQRQAEIAEAQRLAAAQAQEQASAQEQAPAPEARETAPSTPPPAAKGGAGTAVATAAQQIGKPYEWGASGPDSFDCSGLTSYAWAAAGVSLPRSSRAQYSALPKVARDQIQPGDLLFFGNPIHHVGIYEGGGVMINAPQTGETVRRNSINRADYAGAARP